jgi:hypothetical protein
MYFGKIQFLIKLLIFTLFMNILYIKNKNKYLVYSQTLE